MASTAVAAAVNGKTTGLLVGACFGLSSGGILLAAMGASLYEFYADQELALEAEVRRIEAKRACQTLRANAAPAGDTEEDAPIPVILHTTGTEVKIIQGANAGEMGIIAKAGFDQRQGRYVVTVDEEEWYIPAGAIVTVHEPQPGAKVRVVSGDHAGRFGHFVEKHHENEAQFYIKLEEDEEHPPRVLEFEREAGGEWSFSFDETVLESTSLATTISASSGNAKKAGLREGMKIVRINQYPLDPEQHSAATASIERALEGTSVRLEVEDGLYLPREGFDC